MKIGICNDHAGVEYKNALVEYLTGKGYEMVNFGTDTTDSMDYPDVAHPLANAVESGEVDLGIAFCGTGNGMQMSLNKHQGIRAGLCWSVEIGKLIKQHNNANVLVMPARFIPFETVMRLLTHGSQRSSRAVAIREESTRYLVNNQFWKHLFLNRAAHLLPETSRTTRKGLLSPSTNHTDGLRRT